MKPQYIYKNELCTPRNMKKADDVIMDYVSEGWHLINVWTIKDNVNYITTALRFRKKINVI
jgi:hypothetical protein